MTQEEKARAYDEAIKRAKDFKEGVIHYELKIGENIMDYIFPELKESEDEKIRKWIINEIKIKHHNLDEDNIDFVNKAINWLEKQGAQKLANSAKTCKNEQKLFDCKSVQQKEFALKIEPNDYSGIDPYFFKPADKVESKPQGKSAVEANNEVLRNTPVIVDADKAFYNMICEYFNDRRAMDEDETSAFKKWLLSKIKRTN